MLKVDRYTKGGRTAHTLPRQEGLAIPSSQEIEPQ
jgi:hypothetical protein